MSTHQSCHQDRNQIEQPEVNGLMLRVSRNAKSFVFLFILLASISSLARFSPQNGLPAHPPRARIFPENLSISRIRLGMSRQEVVRLEGPQISVKGPWTAYRDVLITYRNETVVALLGPRLEHKGIIVSIGDDSLLTKDQILLQRWKEFLWDDCLLGPPTYFGRDSSEESQYHYGARYDDLKLTLTERNYHLVCVLEPHSSLEPYTGGVP